MVKDIGKAIKDLRSSKKLTLKELSDKTGLSTGYLSQLERGLTTISIDLLENVAKTLDVDLSYFILSNDTKEEVIMRGYNQEVSRIENKFIHSHLSNNIKSMQILSEIVTLLPSSDEEDIQQFPHNGEEFIYVLEGILTLFLNHQKYELYPGDSAQYNSSIIHNWANFTNKTVKILHVCTPNPFKENKDK